VSPCQYWRFECTITYELRSRWLETKHIRADKTVKLWSRDTLFSKSRNQLCEHRSSEKWRLSSREPSVWSGIMNWNVWLHFKEDFARCLIRNHQRRIPPTSGNEAGCIVKRKGRITTSHWWRNFERFLFAVQDNKQDKPPDN